MRALRYLRARLGRRLGLFSLTHQRTANADEAADYAETRGVAFGAGMIHVHSKLILADDDFALLSSANINGRSFRWDTELGFLWHEPGAIGAFRREAWELLLGRPIDFPVSQALHEWREQAVANAALPPERRTGFIVPHQITRARAFARPSWFVPDDLV
jgi:phospholipase D1/2